MAPRVKRNNKRNNMRKNRRTGRSGAAQKKFRLPKPRASVVNQLSNILETKKFQGLDYDLALGQWIENPIETGTMPLNAAGLSFMPDSFYRMQFQTDIQAQAATDPELANNCIEGTSVFSKYLQCKVQIDYPDGSTSPNECPRPVEIIWGWCNPLNYTDFTTPKIDEVTPAEIRDHTLDAIAAEFNSQTDPMEFHDKHKRRYNIIGRKKIIPRLMNQVPTRSLNPGLQGQASAKIHTNINFKMMKKVNYTKSIAKGDTGTPQFAYPSEAYLPFVFLYNADFAMYDVSGVDPIKWKFNDCHWFNDA
ncbi:MAG: hypothetical protein [Circular genetic element sp.]|nr:MAG: hypothetical protein [Circular genetic element sp.]